MPNGKLQSPGDDGGNGDDSLSLVHRLAEIGIALSAERDLDRLLEKIVAEACSFTGADGGTLYLAEGGKLVFSISQNSSLGIKLGGATGAPVSFPPVPMDPSFVSAYAAIYKKTVNVPDVYHSSEFDFTGPKKYDEQTGYRSVSMLVTPMMNHEDEVIGVLQLLNAIDQASGAIIPFSARHQELTECLASQAAVAISNFRLIRETERLFESFLHVMATALDARSKSTHGHVRRVAGIALELARAVNEAGAGTYANRTFSDDEINEIKIAALMHDVGKIITPQHVMDKAVKLETIYDRSDLIRTRYQLIAALAENGHLKKTGELLRSSAPEDELEKERSRFEDEIADIQDEMDFVLNCNNPGEFMEDEKLDRLKKIAATTYTANGQSLQRLSENEVKNLSIRKGSLTDDERRIMEHHVSVTIKMLDKIPFTRKLKGVPEYAGGHHEKLDGSGYPNHLKGYQMPLQTRILALADFVEALTATDRPYKKQMSLERAFQIIQSEADNGHIDKDLFELFKEMKVYERFKEKEKDGTFFIDF